VELADNESAFSVCHVRFYDKGPEVYLLVGTVKDLVLHPRSHSGTSARAPLGVGGRAVGSVAVITCPCRLVSL
jgi:hypothetical protein